ncbi:CAP domain-containing protein [Roseibium limicola]|uniref:CAP domain-containing protein n=1 Tax=Roseibium limicola TaxID=2816037 RepID=A0A939EQ42_9HYPH|nr:CAP domain-containing protein [Roseibium limicola]MBO0346619.1 CAP domain-containing protein [Roseibium limicola]
MTFQTGAGRTGPWRLAALAAAGTSLVLLLAACVSEPQTTPGFYRDLARVDAVVDAPSAANMISHYRANNGLGPVRMDPALTRQAEAQARAMAQAGNVNASLNSGNRLQDLMAAIGQEAAPASNNVSGGYRTLAEAFSGWRESPKHNAVMLDKQANRFGLATAYAPSAKHKVFWSLIMAGPQVAPAGSAGTSTTTAGRTPVPSPASR